jgi:hypothetical protein
MILVSISSSEEKFVIHLKHKINLVIEKKFGNAKALNRKTAYVFILLLLSFLNLLFKEIFLRHRL